MSLEQCNIAVQTVLPNSLIPAGTSLAVFARSLGAAITVGIGQNVFIQRLNAGLTSSLPELDPSIVTSVVSGSGATSLISNVQNATGGNDAIVNTVVQVYNDALTDSFYVAVALASLTLLPALGVEWKSTKKEQARRKQEEADEKEKKEAEKKVEAEKDGEVNSHPGEKDVEAETQDSVKDGESRDD